MKSYITPEAELDLTHAIRWYDERDQILGNGLLREVYKCISSIEANPRLYPIVHHQMRRALVRRFPFQILFEIDSEQITIFAIYHSSRDPDAWKRRGSD